MVSLDSIRYWKYYTTLHGIIGLEYNGGLCNTHHSRLDKTKRYNQTYDKHDAVHKKPATVVRVVKIGKNMQKVIQDKKAGKTYGRGIKAPKPNGKAKQSKTEGPHVTRKHWGKLGHARRTHCSCGKTICNMNGKL
jgi:hypothetical protein